ncbi:ER membrane protein complex subunit 5 [Hippopotamus amphibius kiboko]|uniref:ER membrane protein complex subunit 5 n=1 Tax=Hippopotamus amphibius kiboko TaxID=575201 RepID=UPI00259A22E7|nr:ER membrane protein complex subunit 5 [Hippopotamus amphibius kiboko]
MAESSGNDMAHNDSQRRIEWKEVNAPPPAPRPALICRRSASSLPLIGLRLFFYAVRSAPPLAKQQRGAGPASWHSRTFFLVAFAFFPAFLFPLSHDSLLFSTSQALRAQGFSDVISLRCADTRRWRKERHRRPSLLLLGCCSSGVMAPSLWKGLVGIGLFALAHAAFSAAQHRSYMRLTEKEDESLPVDIVLQTLLAFAVTCYGIVHIAGEFKDMDATSELKNKTFDTLRNHPSFYVFNHRGRVLFRPSDATNSSNQDALSSNTSLKLRKLESLRR